MHSWRLLILLALAHTCLVREANADGGAIRLMETRDQVQITVFTSPTPLRAGDVDVSVLIQAGAAPLAEQELPIELVATPLDGSAQPIRRSATKSAATNKLLQAAKFKLPHAGDWRIDVSVGLPNALPEKFTFEVDAAPAPPRWLTFWPWFSWPLVVIVLFGLHQRSASRSTTASATISSPGSRSDN